MEEFHKHHFPKPTKKQLHIFAEELRREKYYLRDKERRMRGKEKSSLWDRLRQYWKVLSPFLSGVKNT